MPPPDPSVPQDVVDLRRAATQPLDDPTPNEATLDARITYLAATVAARDATIADLSARLAFVMNEIQLSRVRTGLTIRPTRVQQSLRAWYDEIQEAEAAAAERLDAVLAERAEAASVAGYLFAEIAEGENIPGAVEVPATAAAAAAAGAPGWLSDEEVAAYGIPRARIRLVPRDHFDLAPAGHIDDVGEPD